MTADQMLSKVDGQNVNYTQSHGDALSLSIQQTYYVKNRLTYSHSAHKSIYVDISVKLLRVFSAAIDSSCIV